MAKDILIEFEAKGTTCESCSEIIKRQAMKLAGVRSVDFDYSTESGSVTFDPEKTTIDKILYKIEEKGYTCYILDGPKPKKSSTFENVLGWTIAILGLLVIGYFIFALADKMQLPTISQNMSYGLLFLVGLITGFHCIAMCGSFVVSYTAKNAAEGKSSHVSHVWYGTGKIISYTLLGALFGFIGSLIAFTPTMRGVAGILAGLFLILFGLKMLNVFPFLRKLSVRPPKFITKIIGQSNNSGPFVIGLLNGLMIACGPLQAIYIMAAGTGSPIEGAKLLFIFALGTLPVMIGFGYIASYLSSKVTQKILKFSGVLVIVLGLIMLNTGLALSGSGYDFNSIISSRSVGIKQLNGVSAQSGIVIENGYQIIHMNVTYAGYTPNKFVLQKGIPVKWIIDGQQITGCNGGIQVPKYGLKFQIKQGLQTIEFTPTESGTVSWSCWMGMIPGTFIVVDNPADTAAVAQQVNSVPVKTGGTCGGSGGGCGCGMMGR